MQEITLKKFRKSLRLTQKEFAERMGYEGGYISIMEAGNRQFSDNFIDKLNQEFKMEERGYKLVQKLNDLKRSTVEEALIPERQGDFLQEIEKVKSKISELEQRLLRMERKGR
jgi:transcriptional regulator with XRE-family HTH domain